MADSFGVTKCPPPRAKGEGSGVPLSEMLMSDLRGVAASQSAIDPLRGNYLQESDPRAQELLRKNAQHIKAQQEALNLKQPVRVKHGQNYKRGDRVYHKVRDQHGVILQASSDGKRIEVGFPKGEKKLVQLRNLEKS